MKKKQILLDILKQAAILGPQYDYMDDLKLKGWLWEFIRRSAPYKKQYKKFSALAAKISKTTCKEKTLIGLVNCANEIEKLGVRINKGDPNEWDAPDYCAVNLTDPITGNEECWAIPNPDRTYCQFPSEDVPNIGKPVIKGIPYKIVSLMSSLEIQTPEEGRMSLQRFCDMLSPSGNPEEALFFGISKHARDKDIKNVIVPYIQEMLEMYGERSDVRVSSNAIWKHSLFIYDQKKANPRISNSELLDLTKQTFPDDDLKGKDASDVRRYNNNVRDLINVNYRDFLIT